jgi:hypothetical protein
VRSIAIRLNRGGLRLALLALLIAPPLLAQAQTSLLADVQRALRAFRIQSSYRAEGTQTLERAITTVMGESQHTLAHTLTQTISGVIADADDTRAQVTIRQAQSYSIDDSAPVTYSLTLDIIAADGALYLRLSDPQPASQAESLPTGWINLSAEPDAIPGAALITEADITRLLDGLLWLERDSVADGRELESETVDDQMLRVIEVDYDLGSLPPGGAYAALLAAFDLTAYGVESETLAAALAESGSLVMTLWLGADHLPYRAQAALDFSGRFDNNLSGEIEALLVDQRLITTIAYRDYGAGFAIMPPPAQ